MGDERISGGTPVFFDAGDGGLIVQLGDQINVDTNLAVVALAERVESQRLVGVLDVVPTYRSVYIQFDPVVLSKAVLASATLDLWRGLSPSSSRGALWHVPVCYGGACGADLEHVARLHGLDEAEVIRRHTAPTYRIYMIGFAPGFLYLSAPDPAIQTGRRAEPRLRTPPRSVSIGGAQAGVSPPFEVPSGWHLLGQTAVRTYRPERDDAPFPFAPGDSIRFHAVPEEEYRRQCQAADAGDPVAWADRSNG